MLTTLIAVAHPPTSVLPTRAQNMSYDSASLTTSDIMWLGVRPSDLDRYAVPKECRLDMTAEDIDAGMKLLKEDYITVRGGPAF